MGYLDLPRIHVAGRFFADPSTVNNDALHFDPKVENPSPWQDAYGSHYFEFQAATVASALDSRGFPQADDPVVGAAFTSATSPSFPKLVDLDTYQQGTSAIYGLKVGLKLPSGVTLIARVDTPVLNSVWFNRVLPQREWDLQYGWGSYGGDANASGVFVTVARFDAASWPVQSGSPVLDALRAACAEVNGEIVASFQFVLDGYDNVRPPGHGPVEETSKPTEERRAEASLWHGRMIGTLGPWKTGEPTAVAGQRVLRARPWPADASKVPWNVPCLADAPFRFDPANRLLHIDLGNSLCMQYPGGPPADMGPVEARVGGQLIGTVPAGDAVYNDFSGIAIVEVPEGLVSAVASSPVELRATRPDALGAQLWQEAGDGVVVALERRELRMTSPTGGGVFIAESAVYVTRFGVPWDGAALDVYHQPVWGDTKGATMPPGRPGDTIQAAGAVAMAVTAPIGGRATLQVKVLRDPGQRTPWLRSQLYFAQIYRKGEPTPNFQVAAPVQELQLSLVVFADHQVQTNPPFSVVSALMAPYMRLYPSMRERLDLTDEHTFHIYALNPPWSRQPYMDPTPRDGFSSGAIPYFLTRDFDNPQYMPLTRDLSPNEMRTVLNYCRQVQAGSTDPGSADARELADHDGGN